MSTLRIGQEVGAKKSFVWVIDWPGWSRGGKDLELARAALIEVAPRYARVAKRAGLAMPEPGDPPTFEVVDAVTGGAGTDFGIPYEITDDDRRRASRAQAERLASLVEAAWEELDRIARATPERLRKGPRGGGRDRDKMLEHVIGADHSYAREIGVRLPEGSLADRRAVTAQRQAVLDVLRQPSDGSPLAGRKWPLRYAARRIAWHALDHAWEMEDRSTTDP